MTESTCKHPDVRKFDEIRCCLSCGEAVFEVPSATAHVHTSETAGHYRYTKLDYKLGRQIRLVLLLPGRPEDPLQCEIIHVNLEDIPVYDAVSYTWASEDGDAKASMVVQCKQGGAIPVTPNCYAVLLQLRRSGRQRIWVDAICIDQTNISERNHQVGFMDLIYSQARSVCICIHDPSPRKVILPNGRSHWPNYKQLMRWLRKNGPSTNGYPEMSLYGDLQHLFSLRYFKRVWVIQEVALAQTVCLLVNDQALPLTPTAMACLERLYTSRNQYKELPSVLRWFLGHGTKLGIATCLHASMSCNATDPRDRVYAMLSLMDPRARSLISVDYSLTLEAVWRNAIAAIITTQKNLDILSYASVTYRSLSGGHTIREKTLTLHDVYDYLTRSVIGTPELSPPLTLSYLNNCDLVPWCATVNVGVPFLSHHQSNQGHETLFCDPKSPSLLSQNLLPRLRVRAHYIDSVRIRHKDDTTPQNPFFGRNKGSINIRILDFFKKKASSRAISGIVKGMRARSLASRYTLPTISSGLRGGLTSMAKSYFDLEGLDRFLKIGSDLSSWEMFSSQFSVGYRPLTLLDGGAEEIFAIDGINSLFILRKTATQQYRIVSECYLWAAFELDCWNPGTRMGRWGPSVPRPTVEQTRMIEIV